jgi:hypothetical protein
MARTAVETLTPYLWELTVRPMNTMTKDKEPSQKMFLASDFVSNSDMRPPVGGCGSGCPKGAGDR